MHHGNFNALTAQPRYPSGPLAFDRDKEGELLPVVGPPEPRSENSARTIAAVLSGKHAGAIAWKRSAQPDQGEFGEPEME